MDVLANDNQIIGGRFFLVPVGLRIGDAETTEVGHCTFITEISSCSTACVEVIKGDWFNVYIVHMQPEGSGYSKVHAGAGFATNSTWFSLSDSEEYANYLQGYNVELRIGKGLDIHGAGYGVKVREGENCKQGVATLSAGEVVVGNEAVTAESRIFLTAQDDKTVGSLRAASREAGKGFTIRSSNASDAGLVAYEIFEPAS
ncbi:MAG: hypothetical protein ACYCU0_05690 [Solirubrobacteraceae bacterium]